MEACFDITYLELDRHGEWEKVETDAFEIILHNKKDRKLIQLVRYGFSDWIDAENIADFTVELVLEYTRIS